MTTLATNGSIRNPKMTVSLALSINHQVYLVSKIDHNDSSITRAFRLAKKHDGSVYDVCQGEHGAVCDCPDFEVRRNGLDPEGCKHVKALRMMGMLGAAPVIPAPCCPPDEPTACQSCQTSTPAETAADAILARGLELAEAEAVNQPAVIVDHYEDEPPTIDFEPTDADRLAVAEWVTAADIQGHLDRSGELPLVESLDHIAVAFRGWSSPFGSMLADILGELAQKAFMTGATTPHELLTGVATLDREARETWERVGRESVAKPLTDIDDPSVRRGRPQRLNAFGTQPYRRPTA